MNEYFPKNVALSQNWKTSSITPQPLPLQASNPTQKSRPYFRGDMTVIKSATLGKQSTILTVIKLTDDRFNRVKPLRYRVTAKIQ